MEVGEVEKREKEMGWRGELWTSDATLVFVLLGMEVDEDEAGKRLAIGRSGPFASSTAGSTREEDIKMRGTKTTENEKPKTEPTGLPVSCQEFGNSQTSETDEAKKPNTRSNWVTNPEQNHVS